MTEQYKVVVNDEEQYSIWPVQRDNPLGWRDAGFSGSKEACLDHIEEVWTDMRPLSLRQYMEQQAQQPSVPLTQSPSADEPANDLVDRLCASSQPVMMMLRPEPSLSALRQTIERRYVHIKFTETQGGTELSMQLQDADCDLQALADNASKGSITLVGDLTLDFQAVRCTATIDIENFHGTGQLSRLNAAADTG